MSGAVLTGGAKTTPNGVCPNDPLDELLKSLISVRLPCAAFTLNSEPCNLAPGVKSTTKISPTAFSARLTGSSRSDPCVELLKSLIKVRLPSQGLTLNSGPLKSGPVSSSTTRISPESFTLRPKGISPNGPCAALPKSLIKVRSPFDLLTLNKAP